jgi:hypothetical protein
MGNVELLVHSHAVIFIVCFAAPTGRVKLAHVITPREDTQTMALPPQSQDVRLMSEAANVSPSRFYLARSLQGAVGGLLYMTCDVGCPYSTFVRRSPMCALTLSALTLRKLQSCSLHRKGQVPPLSAIVIAVTNGLYYFRMCIPCWISSLISPPHAVTYSGVL